jgi:hypothetical protein
MNGEEPPADGRVRIETLGGFRIRDARGKDVTRELVSHPTLTYLFTYLLSRAIQAHPASVEHSRDAVAEELYPRLAHEDQRGRLRRRLHDFDQFDWCNGVILGGDPLSYALDRSAVDAVEVIDTAAALRDRHGILSGDDLRRAEGALVLFEGEYLPLWDQLEDELPPTGGLGHETVAYVRRAVADARVDLLETLGDYRMALREAARAARLFSEGLEAAPEREVLARKAVAAYLELGEVQRAAAVRQSYGLPL